MRIRTVHNPLRRALVALACLAAPAMAQAPVDLRVALVIGNGAYQHAAKLNNPANDARAMGATLTRLGFRVIELQDGSRTEMLKAVSDAAAALRGKQGVGLLFYAGHGLQVDARNFMVPVDARIAKAGDVPATTVDVAEVIEAFKAAGNRMNIVVLDACRNNPFGGIISGKGLAPLDAPSGTFLAYATAPGNVADDGDAKVGNGLYTQYLLKELDKPQARIEDVFKRVRFSVRQASKGRQIPWESTSLEDDFAFDEGRVVAPALATPTAAIASYNQERVEWDRIKTSTNPDDYYAFLARFPNGTISEAVHARLNALTNPSLVVQGAGADGADQRYTIRRMRAGDTYENRADSYTSFGSITASSTGGKFMESVQTQHGAAGGNGVNITKHFDANGNLERIVNKAGTATFVSTYDPPQSMLPGGLLQVGAKWQSSFRATTTNETTGKVIREQLLTGRSAVLARESVDVLGTRYQAFKVQTTNYSGDQVAAQMTYWLVPHIPYPVRMEVAVPGPNPIKGVEQLARFTPGRD